MQSEAPIEDVHLVAFYGGFAGRLKTSTTCSVEGIGVIEINSHRLSPSSMR